MEQQNSENYKAAMRKMVYICRMHRSAVEKKISTMGVHQSQHHMLMYIAREVEVPTQKQIAEKFGITPAAVARCLKSLETEGFIERENAPEDSRCNRIVITEKGRDIINMSVDIFKETDENMFSGFSEEDMLAFNGYLDMLLNKLTAANDIGEGK